MMTPLALAAELHQWEAVQMLVGSGALQVKELQIWFPSAFELNKTKGARQEPWAVSCSCLFLRS